MSVLQHVSATDKKDEIPLPSHWAPMKGEKVKLVSLKPDCSEYKRVAEHFGQPGGIKKVCVVNICDYLPV